MPPYPKLLRVEKIGGVNLIVSQNVSRWFLFQTSFRKNNPFFTLLPLPRLPYHNTLYDTLGLRAVNSQLAETRGVGKGSYAQEGSGFRKNMHCAGSEDSYGSVRS
jgi:hypothetical protein